MTDGEITLIVGWPTEPQMVKFRAVAKASAAKEREMCAKLCEEEAERWRGEQDISDFRLCAARIRAGA